MARSTKESWLAGPGDLAEEEVEDVPVKGESVKIRALSATAANGATSDAITTTEVRGQQVMKVDSVKLDQLRFQAGVVEPDFTLDEVRIISAKYGPAFNKVIAKIVEISGLSNEAVQETEARFPSSGIGAPASNGADTSSGDARSPKPVRASA